MLERKRGAYESSPEPGAGCLIGEIVLVPDQKTLARRWHAHVGRTAASMLVGDRRNPCASYEAARMLFADVLAQRRLGRRVPIGHGKCSHSRREVLR
jgi:hypothetical protein